MERFITLSEAAEHLNVTTRKVYELVRSGELGGIQVGGRNQWRVPSEALHEYLAHNDGDDEPPPAGALV